jgi:hypothetical protein
MTEVLKKFKNVSIKVEELETAVEIRIEPIDTSKEIKIYYKPSNHYLIRGELLLTDNHKEIQIERSYIIGTPDGDIDWDVETIFPCQRCERTRKYIEELSNKIKKLKEQINKLID